MAKKKTVKSTAQLAEPVGKKPSKKKSGNEFGFSEKQVNAMSKLQEFMKKQSKELDFSLNANLLADRVGRNGATPTTSLCVDLILGGGIPKHRLTVISGLQHTGKTTIMQGAMGNQMQKGTLVHYLDFEGSSDGAWMKNATGVNFDHYSGKNFFPLLDMPTGDDAFRYITRMFDQTNELGLNVGMDELTHLICLDSIPSLVPEDLLENDEAGSKPYIALMLSKWLPIVRAQLKRSNSSMIAINQIRQKVRLKNPYENPEYEPGGNAVQFLADLKFRFDIVKPKHVAAPDGKAKDHRLLDLSIPKQGGLSVETNPDGTSDSYVYRKVKTFKNRVFPPLKETFVRICTSHRGGEGRGIDVVFDTLNFYEEIGRLTWTGKDKITLDGKEFSYFDLKNQLELPNPELRAEALEMMDNGKAFEQYFARLGGAVGKPDDDGGDEDAEE